MTATDPQELLPTRRSLLSKLKSWENQESWREFFNTYWKLIFDVAKKAGLDDAEAQEAVQETVISVAKEMKEFQYDPAKGGFKRWLLTIARRRILDQMRKRYRNRSANALNPDDTSVDAEIAKVSEETVAPDALWDAEWKTHLLAASMARVRGQVKAEHFQIFEQTTVHGWSIADTAKAFNVSRINVHVIRHRIGGLVKKELKRLEEKLI
ncbi:MAG: sigma-70 family RNA polymerase sigma factor [Verrucomicrobia bacterium]|nr:sigma-70 family RNA polymerase sigma factor [Verrucomicrobiota bacterium]MBI3866992.1 sigma-70 family RNA polymerase sigma factor [Verrucomicrobiota bacterium]